MRILFCQHYYDLLGQSKSVKADLKKYYFLIPNNNSIRLGAQYSLTSMNWRWQEVKMAWRTGSKDDRQIEKLNSQWKTHHLQKPRKKIKFSVYIAILKTGKEFLNYLKNLLSLFGYLCKMGEKGPLKEASMWREVVNE